MRGAFIKEIPGGTLQTIQLYDAPKAGDGDFLLGFMYGLESLIPSHHILDQPTVPVFLYNTHVLTHPLYRC